MDPAKRNADVARLRSERAKIEQMASASKHGRARTSREIQATLEKLNWQITTLELKGTD